VMGGRSTGINFRTERTNITTMRALLRGSVLFFASFGLGFFILTEFLAWFVQLYQMMGSGNRTPAFQLEMGFLTIGPFLIAALLVTLYSLMSYTLFVIRYGGQSRFEMSWFAVIAVFLGSFFGCIWKTLHMMASV
jgi:hypothetical protein